MLIADLNLKLTLGISGLLLLSLYYSCFIRFVVVGLLKCLLETVELEWKKTNKKKPKYISIPNLKLHWDIFPPAIISPFHLLPDYFSDLLSALHWSSKSYKFQKFDCHRPLKFLYIINTLVNFHEILFINKCHPILYIGTADWLMND